MPTAELFLELLAREAAPIEFEGPLVEARASGASGAQLAELEQAKVVALRVRACWSAAAAVRPSCPGCSTPPATWPVCATSTPCCTRSCTGPATCSTPTSPT